MRAPTAVVGSPIIVRLDVSGRCSGNGAKKCIFEEVQRPCP